MKEVKIVGINFRQWIISPKNLAALLCLMLYTYDQLHGMADMARTFDCNVTPWLLPFFLCTAHRFLPVMLLFLLLISDAPFRTRQQGLVILRTGKRTWLRGQLLYLAALSVGYTALVWVLSWVWYLPELSWENAWGNVIRTASQGLDPAVFGVYLNFPYRIIKSANPIATSLWCSCVMILVCYMLGAIMTACNLWLRKGMGAVITSALVGIALIPELFVIDPGIMKMVIWISPVSWMDRALMGNGSQNLPSYAFGIWMPAFIGILVSAGLVLTIGKCCVETDGDGLP